MKKNIIPKTILWVGSVLDDKNVLINNIQSPAANLWQCQQIKEIKNNSVIVEIVSHVPIQSFPYGDLFIKGKIDINNVFQHGYLNIKIIRELTLFINKSRSIVKKHEGKNIVFYNTSLCNILIALFFKLFTDKKIIQIVADGKEHYIFDKFIYLSYGQFIESKKKNIFFFDQPALPFKGSAASTGDTSRKKITYCGALSRYGGITEFSLLFSKALKLDSNLNFELHILGHGKADQKLLDICNKNKHIFFHGYLDQCHFESVMSTSHFFVNPRPIGIAENKYNFPSKLITYLQYGRPILSTKTYGISPLYDSFIIYNDLLDDKMVKKGLHDLLISNIRNIEEKIKFFSKHNSEKKKIKKLAHFIISI